jgi:hypothetical protein
VDAQLNRLEKEKAEALEQEQEEPEDDSESYYQESIDEKKRAIEEFRVMMGVFMHLCVYVCVCVSM